MPSLGATMRGRRQRVRRVVLLLAVIAFTMGASGCLEHTNGGTAETGTLEGHLTIGPICPVERLNVTCPVPPEAYAARKVVVTTGDGSSVVAVVALNETGYYHVSLNPGSYRIDINHAGSYRSGDVPTTLTIEPGKTIVLDIRIDTGIR